MDTVKLSNGLDIPSIAYGSAIVDRYRYWSDSKKSQIKYYARNYIKDRNQYKKDIGIKNILRKENEQMLIDTSRAYGGSENIIGQCADEKSIVCTKICNKDQINNSVELGFNKSLDALNRTVIDILLMHWPVENKYIDTWRIMESLYKKGKVKAIGVCNCNIHHLEEIKRECEIVPMINQFECHPLFTQNELRQYCKENNIKVMAYTATARMDDRLKNTILPEIARNYGKSMTQIIIRWHIQLGNIPIINTSSYRHYVENKDVFDFELTQEDVERISKININSRLRYDPENCDFNKL